MQPVDLKAEMEKQLELHDHLVVAAIGGIAAKAITESMRDLPRMQVILEAHASIAVAFATASLAMRDNARAQIQAGFAAGLAELPARRD